MKKKKRGALILILAVLFAVFSGILLINKIIKINPFFARRYEMRGVDVSHYQGTIDWQKLAEQDLDFAFIKATEGSSYLDECFYDNWQAAGKTELYIGAYHFFSFDSEGRKQAEFFIDTVGNLEGKLPPVIDVEFYGDKAYNPPEKEEVVTQLGEMLSALEEHYQVKPIIYTTYTVYNEYIRGEFQEYPLWIRNVYYPSDVTLRGEWSFWQYMDTAVLAGYEGTEKYIDLNVFRGTKEELEMLLVREEEGNGISLGDDQKSGTQAEKENENGSFWIYNNTDDMMQEISLSNCNLWYDNSGIKVYAYFGTIQALFIQAPEREEVIYPVCGFWIDQEEEVIWLLKSKEIIQIQKVNLRQNDFLSKTLMLDQKGVEALISDVYGLAVEKGEENFRNLTVDLSGTEGKNGETVLGGMASGVYKKTNKRFYIVYEINRENGAVNVKGYLQNLSISPLYQEFLFHNLTVDNPLTDNNKAGLGKELSYFDDKNYLSEFGNFNKYFALKDVDRDGMDELIFCMKAIEGEEEIIYVLKEKNGQFFCQNVFFMPENVESQYDMSVFSDAQVKWFNCTDFLDIPTDKCEESGSREEVFDAVEDGDFSVVMEKYADPDRLVEELKSIYKTCIISENMSARMARCDVNGDGFEEFLFLVKYDFNSYEEIEFILAYRNGRAICIYFDWCDGNEWLILGDKGRLIRCLYSDNGFCEYKGYYGCILNAKGIKDLDYTGYGVEICDVYSPEESGFWWQTEQLPEITGEGIYYVRIRPKTVEVENSDETAGEMIKELISKDEFLEEYRELTGKEFVE